MRRTTGLTVAVPLLALLAACGNGAMPATETSLAPSSVPASVTPSVSTAPSVGSPARFVEPSASVQPPLEARAVPEAAQPATPALLAGAWRVRAGGAEPGAVLTLDDYEFTIWQACSTVGGSWKGDAAGLFAADVNQGHAGCVLGTPAWLADAWSAVVDGQSRLLLDRTGKVLAELEPGGRATSHPDGPDFEVPTANAALRTASKPAAPLPAGLVPATVDRLAGTWAKASGPVRSEGEGQATATLHRSGSWGGTDGCNGSGGVWRSGADGAFFATSGPSTLIYCESIKWAVDGSVAAAARAGFDGELLVLFDHDGKKLDTLRRL